MTKITDKMITRSITGIISLKENSDGENKYYTVIPVDRS